MGGCQSSSASLLTGSLFSAPGLSDLPSGKLFGYAGNSYASKQGCGRSKSVIIQSFKEIVATSVVVSLTQCNSVQTSAQEITINCRPQTEEGKVFEENSSCGNCIRNVFDSMTEALEREESVWKKNPAEARVRLPIDSQYDTLSGRIGACGAFCKACFLSNLSQASIISSSSKCYENLQSSKEFETNFSSLMKQQLSSNQDLFAGVLKVLGSADEGTLATNLYDKVKIGLTTEFLTNVATKLKQQQVIAVSTNGSTSLSNVTQYSAFNAVMEELTAQNVINNILEQFDLTTALQVANERNTLDSFGNMAFDSIVTFASAIQGTVFQILIAVLALLGSVVIGILVAGIYRVTKKIVQASSSTATAKADSPLVVDSSSPF